MRVRATMWANNSWQVAANRSGDWLLETLLIAVILRAAKANGGTNDQRQNLERPVAVREQVDAFFHGKKRPPRLQ